MKMSRLTAAVVTLVSVGSLLFSLEAQAQKKYSISEAPSSNSEYLQEHIIDVGDRPGHQLRVYEIRFEYPKKDLAFAGVLVKQSMTTGMSDYINWSGSFTTYTVYTMDDGNQVYSRTSGTTQSTITTEGQRAAFKFSFVENFIGGTGKFRGMRGQTRGGGERAAGAKSLSQHFDGEYWIEE